MNENKWKSKGENLIQEFFKSRKNSNCLLELEDLLLSSDEECVLSMLPVALDFFSKVFSKGWFNYPFDIGKNCDFRCWVLSRYEDIISHLLTYLSHDSKDIQIEALKVLLLFIKLESEHPPIDENENPNFPFCLFKKIVSGLASSILNQYHLVKVFQEYTHYHDIKLYLLKSVQQLFEESKEVSEIFLQNCFYLLCSMKYPKKFEDPSSETFAYRSAEGQSFLLKEKPFRKMFTTIWSSFLNCDLSTDFLKKLLPIFNDNILPHMQNPCLLTDFLTNSYNKGGVLSLLALKGLYFLMDSYNLEYPDFYVKLYALLDEDIVNGKYSSKFFDLTALFLSSTHLPAHIVAAFAKKLCRLSLVSSTNNVLKILCLVSNLLVDHPSLKILIHQPNAEEDEKDPFYMDALDPSESNALKSSLWEIQTLKSHINPEVSCKAKRLSDEYPKFHRDISEVSSLTLSELYVKVRKRKISEVPLAVHRPVKRKS